MGKLQVVLVGGPYNGQPKSLGKRVEYIKLENPRGGEPCWYRRTTEQKYFYAGNHAERPERDGDA